MFSWPYGGANMLMCSEKIMAKKMLIDATHAEETRVVVAGRK